jgi:hypothetical protein
MSDAVTEGRAAWQRIKGCERKSWNDWLLVGEALAIGKAAALRAANTNRPGGSRYNKIMGKWLRDNGLADITPAERYRILLILENCVAIETWRASLDDVKRRKLNHPGAIWAHWSRASGMGKSGGGAMAPKANGGGMGMAPRRPYAGNRPICFDQEAVRRAGLAMKESRSSDWFKLAGIALHAAIRDRGDVLALLGDCARPSASAIHVPPQQAAFPAIGLPAR